MRKEIALVVGSLSTAILMAVILKWYGPRQFHIQDMPFYLQCYVLGSAATLNTWSLAFTHFCFQGFWGRLMWAGFFFVIITNFIGPVIGLLVPTVQGSEFVNLSLWALEGSFGAFVCAVLEIPTRKKPHLLPR